MIPAPTLPAASTRRLGHSRRVSSPSPRPAVVIVGGGISGLAAAFFLRDRGLAVTVLEGSPRLGGKLAVSEIAGIEVDEGAEALLARRPEGTDLIGAVGLAGQLVSPGTTAAADLDPRPACARCRDASSWACRPTWTSWTSSGILSPPGLARAREDLRLPPTPRDGDVAGGQLRRGEIRPGARGPAGGSAARRGLRGPVGGAVLRGDAGRPGAGRAAAPLARRRRPRRCCPPRGSGSRPAASSPRWRAASARCRPPSRPGPARPCGPAR